MAKSKKDFSDQAQGMGFNAWFQKTDTPEPVEESTKSQPKPRAKAKTISQSVEDEPLTQELPTEEARKPAKRKSKKAMIEKSASERGCKEGDTRKTFIIRKDLAEQIQDVAYWEPGKLKDHVNAALEAYVKKKWTKKRPKGA